MQPDSVCQPEDAATAENGGDRAIDTLFVPFTTGGLGGSHISGALLGAGQAERYGVRVVIAGPKGAKVSDLAGELGLEWLELDDPARSRHPPLYDLLRAPGRARLLRKLGPRVLVHTNDLAALQAWGIPARLARFPVVHHNRAFDRPGAGMRAVFGMASRVICVSHACSRNLGFIPAERRTVLWDDFTTAADVDGSEARAALLAELGAPDHAKLVGFVGNFWKRKRPDFFLNIARAIADRRDDVFFILFGVDGDISKAELEQKIIELRLENRVLLAGFRRPPERNLKALDLLLMPTLAEPCTRSLIEAAILGVPYVAANDAGSSEIYAHWAGGVMVPPAAPPGSYADAALALLANVGEVILPPGRRREIAASLRPAAQAERVMDVYRRTV